MSIQPQKLHEHHQQRTGIAWGLPLLALPASIYVAVGAACIPNAGMGGWPLLVAAACWLFSLTWTVVLSCMRGTHGTLLLFAMLNKLLLVPWYVLAFIVGAMTLFMPHAGFIVTIIIAAADFLVLIATSLAATTGTAKMLGAGECGGKKGAACIVLSWVWCADVVAAVIAWSAHRAACREGA